MKTAYLVIVGVDTRSGDRVGVTYADDEASAQAVADYAAAEAGPNMIGRVKWISDAGAEAVIEDGMTVLELES